MLRFAVIIVLLMAYGLFELRANPVQNGEVNLKSSGLYSQKQLDLHGQWLFFANRFITAKDVKHLMKQEKISRKYLSPVPDAFTENSYWDLNFGGAYGSGSYLIALQDVDFQSQLFGLQLRIDTSWEMFWFEPRSNDWRPLEKAGTVGNSVESSRPSIANPIVILPAIKSPVVYLVIHVANYHYRTGSIWRGPTIQVLPEMIKENQNIAMRDYFCLGALIMISLYYFSLYFHRKDPVNLWLSLSSFVISMRLASTSTYISSTLLGDGYFAYELIRKFEYAGAPLAISFGIMFFRAGFKERGTHLLHKVIIYACFFIALYTFLLPARIHTNFLWPMQMTVLGGLLYILYLSVKAIYNRKTGAQMLTVGVLITLLAGINDLMIGAGFRDSKVFLTQYGIVAIVFFQGQVVAQLFAIAFRTAEVLTRELQVKVEEKTRDISMVMNQVPLGICTISKGGKIDPVHSKYLRKMFKLKDLAGLDAISVFFESSDLDADKISLLRSTLDNAFGQDLLCYEVNQNHLPREITFCSSSNKVTILEILWHPVVGQSEEVEKILVSFRDVTRLKELSVQAEAKEKQVKILQELWTVGSGRLQKFLKVSADYLKKIESNIYSGPGKAMAHVDQLHIVLHTMKGLARTYGLTGIALSCHESETALSFWKSNEDKEDAWLSFLESITSLNITRKTYVEIYDKVLGDKSRSDYISLERNFVKRMLSFGMNKKLPAEYSHMKELLAKLEDQCFVGLDMCLRETANEAILIAHDLGKPLPRINVAKSDFTIAQEHSELINSFLVHIMRNSLDHGIETSDERIDVGKEVVGLISVEYRETADWLELVFSDDGRGLDLNLIRKKAQDKGLLLEQNVTDMEIASLIFRSEFSTRSSVSETSGRGVGMNAVRSLVESVGGEAKLEFSEPVNEQNRSSVAFRLVVQLPWSLFQKRVYQSKREDVA